MAQKNRSKEIWLVPKRSNLHQMVCLVDGIIDRAYDGKTWDTTKQNNLGVNLKKWGATKNGKNISNQSVRTLLALPQYLGFLYLKSNGTKSTLHLTESGKLLHQTHIDDIVEITNLKEGNEDTIVNSEIVLMQLEKLQITNPIILKDCENIFVFPFRITIRLLLELEYLDIEELAYFVFNIKDESEVNLKVQEIKNFRCLTDSQRESLINDFKKTHIGNITLVKAPSSAYYIKLCEMTGLISKITSKPINKNKKLSSIRIKDSSIDLVNSILEKYKDIDSFDFGNNLELWIEYIGEPKRINTPIEVEWTNKTNKQYFIQITKDGIFKGFDIFDYKYSIPVFPGEEYKVELISLKDGSILLEELITPSALNNNYEITGNFDSIEKEVLDKQIITCEILEHSSSPNFAGDFLNYLKVISKTLLLDKTKDKYLRGARYEHLFYKLLTCLEQEGIIDTVIWNGKIGEYGLPTAAPGGKYGSPDIVFFVKNIAFVLEVTTIKSKSGQEKAEVSSVPDHINIFKQNNPDYEVIGIFCAPLIHLRNSEVMRVICEENGIKMISIPDNDLVKIFLGNGGPEIIDAIRNFKHNPPIT